MTKEMNKRITSLFLAFTMLFQIFLPQNIFAEGDKSLPQDKYVKVGMIDGKSYDAKIMKGLNRIAAKNRKSSPGKPGVRLFSSGPYFGDNNEPKDADKPKYFGNVSAKLDLKGLDGNDFQWNEIFGVDESGNPKPARIIFRQMDEESSTDTGIEYILQITKGGKYTWSDGEGKPTKLPLFSKSLKPYRYEVRIDERVSDKVKLLTEVIFGTEGSSPTFSPENADGEIIANITLGLTYQQIASTKFKSEWHTDVVEANRPGMKANFAFDDEGDGLSPVSVELPKNDKDTKIIRDWYNEFEPDLVISYYLEKTPDVKIDETTTGLTFEENNGVKIVKSGDHKFKYHFKYDVINGGKLTMTEILPVTFDANGGEFKNFTAPDTKTKIIKEVEYGKDLTGKAENPTKPFETFKGWSTTEKGKTPIMDEDLKNIKEAKTLYAIWDNNKITAEKLTVHESFKADGAAEYTNDFIPTLETLKKQVKIMGADGKPQALADTDTFEILNDSNNAIAGDALKDYLYGKLQEKDNPKDEPTRIETVKAKITHKNGTSQTVDIPIKVIKNIYEAKTLTKKPYYVPADYVMVTVNPTDKAKDPQKTYYYVNKEAQVVIPGQDPTGKGDNKFIKWTYLDNGTETEYKLSEKPRHQFKDATTITAQYVSDVIPQDGPNKPDTVPKNFVSVTFVPTDNGTMDGSKIFWVNPEKEVTIPVTDPKGATYYTFKEWKLGANADGDVYNPSTPKKFTEATTITATYDEAKNIIPYDPTNFNDPKIVRPDGYVRVTFEAETGLKLTENKAYYVKKNAKDAQGQPLTLANTELAKPGVSAETGYKFENKWEPADTTKIETTDIVVKAKATPISDTVEKKDGVQKPDGYVEVKFVAGDNGKLTENNADIAEKVYYVNPNKYVTITPPTAVGNTGYEFGAWNKDAKIPTQYKDPVTTITANFNKLKAVIPKINDQTKKPDGYVTVTFKLKDKNGSESKDGYISETTPSEFFVNPNIEVILTEPKVVPKIGYELKGWNPELNWRKYTKDTEIIGSFNRLDDIIPEKKEDGTPNAKPDGYITVTFDKGDHGKEITGQTVYYVNPKADPAKTIGEIKKPTVKAETGWKQKAGVDAWDLQDDMKILGPGYVIVKAQYDPIDDVVPKDNPQGGENEKPADYITVTFSTETNGKVKGTADTKTKVVYINPNKVVALDRFAPEVTPNAGYTFARWDTSINKAIQYKDGDKITALYNEPGTISKTEVADYVKVEFKPGTNGELKGTTDYWIKPGVEVNIPAPTVNPKVGYKFDKWDKSLTVMASAGDPTYEITAIYAEEDTIIPKTKADDSEKPNGYVTVNFITDGNGSLEGTTTYFVNPNKEADFTQTAANMIKKPKIGYTEKGGSWTPKEFKKTFTENEEFKFKFVELKDVIPAKENEARPEGYVTVTLIPTDKATDQTKANKSYWVKANTDISISSKPTGKTEKLNEIEYTYTFKGWRATRGTIASWNNETINGKFIQDTEITALYNTKVDGGIVVAAPVPKKNAVTPVGDKPKAEDLIGNPFNPKDPANPNNLPKDSKISYADNGEPSVDQDGKVTAKVKIEYPNGKTTVIDVPVTVVNNVVPQVGNNKPLVPDTYVKVTVDTTDNATANTKFTKVFWVKPNVKVTIPDILDPTGKAIDEQGVTKTNKFKQWKLEGSNPEKFYDHGSNITDTFTAKESTIVATYEQDKNVEPKAQDNVVIPKDSKPSPKDFIKNPYNDNDPNNKDNLPPGTIFEFVPGKEPNTANPGEGTTTIKITYPNGEKRTVDVPYRVTENIVEQPGDEKPSTVPNDFVKVTIVPTDKAKDKKNIILWVNPNEELSLPLPTVEPIDGWLHNGWSMTAPQSAIFGNLPRYYRTDTVIKANFSKIEKPKEPERIVDTRVETRVIEVPVRDRNYRKEVWYMCGFGGDFRPHDGLKRSEAAQILANALREDGYKYDPNYPIAYKDVGKNWYAEAVRITTQANVFVGYPDGYFRPDDKISTVEWIATLRRFQQIAKEDGNHMNLRTGHWATGEIEAAYKAGWLGIYPQGLATFKADTPMPREEVAAVSNRAFNRVMDRDYIRRNDKNMTHYRDVNPSMWSYDDILLASNTFMHDGRFFKAHGITQDNVIFNVNIDGLTITQDLFQRVKR